MSVYHPVLLERDAPICTPTSIPRHHDPQVTPADFEGREHRLPKSGRTNARERRDYLSRVRYDRGIASSSAMRKQSVQEAQETSKRAAMHRARPVYAIRPSRKVGFFERWGSPSI